jgi:hypothetical protein
MNPNEPTPEALARIAASLARPGDKPEALAAQALALWRACGALLAGEQVNTDATPELPDEVFPMELEDFLRYALPNEQPGNRLYLYQQAMPLLPAGRAVLSRADFEIRFPLVRQFLARFHP